MKYIGPFLRINKLKKENIENQLFYLAKESLKQIVLYSKCGVYTSFKELKIKNSSNFDINTFKNLSPLLCIYKKASPKLINLSNKLCWDYDKFKKEINIDSNALMTLSLLELYDYYITFKDLDSNKLNLGKLYGFICKKQLEFYASYFRNAEGVFVDKKDETDEYASELKFLEKNKKFKFSSQALLMCAYYKYFLISEDEDKNNYQNFSLDILNMFIEFREDLYQLQYDELTKICMALNIFYSYSKNEDCKILLIDLCELLSEKKEQYELDIDEKIELDCMEYINYVLLYNNAKLDKFKNKSINLSSDLLNLYDPEKGIFLKFTDSKDINFSCIDIVSYLLVCIINSNINEAENKSNLIILDVFKRQLIDSGIILSWPDTPELNDIERYKNFSLKSEDLLEDQFFRMPSIATPENTELASIFAKHVVYNKKKETFKISKQSFDAYKNMYVFFLIIFLLKPMILNKNK